MFIAEMRERGAALRIKATARPLCSAGTGIRGPGLPTPDCAKSAVRPLGPVLGLRAAPLPARGKISWSDIARQSLSWAEVGPRPPPPGCGRVFPAGSGAGSTGEKPAGGGAAGWRGGAGCQRASPGLYSVSPEDTWEMRWEEDRHNFRANWLLRT